MFMLQNLDSSTEQRSTAIQENFPDRRVGPVLGHFYLAENERYTATVYSASAYQRMICISDHRTALRTQNTYHSLGDLSIRGMVEDRRRFLQDLRKQAIQLEAESHQRLLKMLEPGVSVERMSNEMKRVAAGHQYSLNDLEPSGRLRYVRGFYFQGGHAKLGIVIGRANFSDPTVVSTLAVPVIDKHIRRNFGTTNTPSEDTAVGQRGTLLLEQPGECTSKPLWTLPYNDTFVLGAIHFGNDVHLATDRSPRQIFSNQIGGQLSVFGREVAIVFGSKAYDLHCSRVAGETFKFVGTPLEHDYNVAEMMETVRDVSKDALLQASLSWFHDAKQSLAPEQVMVISYEVRDDRLRWIDPRRMR